MNQQVYFIQHGDTGPIKIGISNNPERRQKELQRYSGHPLHIIKLIDGDEHKEKSLHQQFKHLRLHHEWFKADQCLMDFIRDLPGEYISKAKALAISAIYYVEKLVEARNLLNEEKDRHLQYVQEQEEALREKEQEISDLVRKNEALNMSLKMLPGGKSPEEIRSDYEAEQRKKQDIAQIMGELQRASGIFQGKRRQALLEKLHKLLFSV